MRVGIAQIDISLFNIEKNIEKHIYFIKKAKELEIDLLVFPELSLTGYFINEHILNCAMPISSGLLTNLKNECQDIRVIFGLANEKRNFLVYNSAVVFNNKELEFIHDKNNLPNYHHLNEKAIFAPSYEANSFEIDEKWKYSILICADLWNPKLVHDVMLNGTNLLIVPFCSAIKGDVSYENEWKKCFDFYSMMYGTYIIAANRVGKEKGFVFYGGSIIANAYGEIEIKAKNHEEDLIYADISYEHIKKARYASPNLKNIL